MENGNRKCLFFIFHLVADSYVSYSSLQLQLGDKANDSCEQCLNSHHFTLNTTKDQKVSKNVVTVTYEFYEMCLKSCTRHLDFILIIPAIENRYSS